MMTRKVICLDLGHDQDSRKDVSLDGWDVRVTENLGETRRMLANSDYQVGVALFDRLNGVDWNELGDFFSSNDSLQWVALAAPEIKDLDAFRNVIATSFFDYHTLPVDESRLADTLGHAWGMATLNGAAELNVEYSGEYGMIGASVPMLELFKAIGKAGPLTDNVLISGESGTGKQLVAHAIHQSSRRSDQPFVIVDCKALPGDLLHAALFGYERGVFDDMRKGKPGSIESADGGTVFLNEVGSLGREAQASLLRFLQTQAIERLGGDKSIAVDVRVIAATSLDLESALQDQSFRADLYQRLNMLRVRVPPLREREGDVELIARHHFEVFRQETPTRARDFSRQALVALNRYRWPGNVAELLNRVRQGVVMCEKRLIHPQDLGLVEEQDTLPTTLNLDEARANAEAKVIGTCLQTNNHNISMTARQLGVSRVTLYRMIKKLGIGL